MGFTRGKQLSTHLKKFHPGQGLDYLPLNIVKKPRPDQPWLCPVCQSGFKNEKSVKNHLKKSHPDENPGIYSCDLCSEEDRFSLFKELLEHIKIQHDDDQEILQELVKKYPGKKINWTFSKKPKSEDVIEISDSDEIDEIKAYSQRMEAKVKKSLENDPDSDIIEIGEDENIVVKEEIFVDEVDPLMFLHQEVMQEF